MGDQGMTAKTKSKPCLNDHSERLRETMDALTCAAGFLRRDIGLIEQHPDVAMLEVRNECERAIGDIMKVRSLVRQTLAERELIFRLREIDNE